MSTRALRGTWPAEGQEEGLLLGKDFGSSKGKAGEELVAAETAGMLPASSTFAEMWQMW